MTGGSGRTSRRLGVAVALGVLALTAGRPQPEVTLDPFRTTAAEVAAWRAAGTAVTCRLRVDVWEPDLPDAGRFPATALGPPTGAAPGQRWLDPAAWPRLAPIFGDRARLCREKGFDRVCHARAAVPGEPCRGGRRL